MSKIINIGVVGPRPCTPYEYDQYLPWQKERFDCLPGLTGLWQVSGKNYTTFVEMVCLDIQYAHHPSLLQDLIIILRTVPTLLEQVYGVVHKPLRKKSKQPQKQQQTIHGADFIANGNGHAANGHATHGHSMNGHANGNGNGAVNGKGAVPRQPEHEPDQEVIRSKP